MSIQETFKSAIRAMMQNKVRSFLTMLGVIIGVFAVVSLVSLVTGFKNYITDQFNSFGSNLVFVSPGRADFSDDPALSFTNNRLDTKHVDLIKKNTSNKVLFVSPSIRVSKAVTYKTKKFYAAVTGGSAETVNIFDLGLSDGSGRYYTDLEERSGAQVVVLGYSVKKELFGSRNPVGEKVKIDDETFTVIGTSAEKGADFDEQVYIPYTTAKDAFDLNTISSIVAKVDSTENIDIAMKEIEVALLKDLKRDDFTILSQRDVLNSIQNILGVITAGLGAVAGVSLLVGGIGIMNIMLVSVTERIKEIGLRKALGATSFNIGLQFLIESITISLLGGMIGVGFGYLATLAARAFINAAVPLWAVGLALGFSVFVGIVFGTYPAYKASKKDPIEALRYE